MVDPLKVFWVLTNSSYLGKLSVVFTSNLMTVPSNKIFQIKRHGIRPRDTQTENTFLRTHRWKQGIGNLLTVISPGKRNKSEWSRRSKLMGAELGQGSAIT